MGRSPQEDVRIEHRRTQVAELYLKGTAQAVIAKELGVSQPTISSDMKAIRQEWRESRIQNVDEAKDEARKRLEMVVREACIGWQQSREPLETTRFIQHNDQKKVEKTIRQRTGDPRFLQIVLRAITEDCQLLGLDAADQPDGGKPDFSWDSIYAPARRDDPIEERLRAEEEEGRDSCGTADPDGQKSPP